MKYLLKFSAATLLICLLSSLFTTTSVRAADGIDATAVKATVKISQVRFDPKTGILKIAYSLSDLSTDIAAKSSIELVTVVKADDILVAKTHSTIRPKTEEQGLAITVPNPDTITNATQITTELTAYDSDKDPKTKQLKVTQISQPKTLSRSPVNLTTGNIITGKVVTAPTEFGAVSDIGQYASRIMQYALPLGIILSILSVIYGGIRFMLSQGQPDQVKEGKEIIQGAVLGLVVLILARALVNFLLLPDINGDLPKGNSITTQELER